jgi:hypothetical protein
LYCGERQSCERQLSVPPGVDAKHVCPLATSPSDLVNSVQAMFAAIPQKKIAQISQ